MVIFDTLFIWIAHGSNATLSVIDLLCLIMIGLLDSILYIPFLADKDFSKRQWIIMNIFYFIGINITTLVFGYFLCWFSFSKINSFITLEGVILCTYSLVMFFFYKVDVNTAEKMNERLKELEE